MVDLWGCQTRYRDVAQVGQDMGVTNALGALVGLLICLVPFQIVFYGISNSEQGRVLGSIECLQHIFIAGGFMAGLRVTEYGKAICFLVIVCQT